MNYFSALSKLTSHYIRQSLQNFLNAREFKGASVDKSNYRWQGSSNDINRGIKWNWRNLLGRSREQSKNNAYFKGWLGFNRDNIVGPVGFSLQSKVLDKSGNYDEVINDKIEAAFEKFSEKDNCTVHKNLSFLRLQLLLVDQWKRDGEILLRKVFNADNPFAFAFETFEIEDLDHELNQELPSGNVIIMGVEYDKWKAPVRYYIKKRELLQNLGTYYSKNIKDYNVYEAFEIIHGFDLTHPRQVRGIPEAAAVLIETYNLDRWEDASLKNAIASARNMGFISRKAGDLDTMIKPQGSGSTDSTVPPGSAFDFKDNVFTFLDEGENFVGFDPKFPLEQHESFVKSLGRKIATGLKIGFNKLFNNYESVNFSSLRSSELTDQRKWMLEQQLFIEMFFNNFYRDWLYYAILSGQLKLSLAKIDEYNKPFWQPTRWAWVDPVKDITAVKLALEENLTTLTDELSKQGKDFNDIIKRRKQELEKLKELALLKKEIDELTNKSTVETTIQDEPENNSDDNSRAVLKIIGGKR